MNDVSGGSGDDGLLRANESLAIDAREKQELRAALEAKEKELVSVKSRNYDLVKEKEALQQEITGLQAQCQKAGRRKPKIRSGKKKKSGGKKKGGSIATEATADDEDRSKEERDPEQFYATIAERFPRLYLSSVLLAERKFQAADVNGDGTIDYEELEAILDKSGCLFTQKEVREILSSIDVDRNESIDLMECLEVLSRLQENKPTRVAHGQALASGTSGICSIQ
ncbi:uncharacterized protein [Oscarella lobularis]|uniref:uncharacterized protein n=1 Tax=Oscarella lobularis TaxID=121494 RepID=UPI003313590C